MKLAKIKWEKITALILTPLFSYIIGLHTVRSNLDFKGILLEFLIYGLVEITFCAVLYTERKSFLEQWKKKKTNIIFSYIDYIKL